MSRPLMLLSVYFLLLPHVHAQSCVHGLCDKKSHAGFSIKAFAGVFAAIMVAIFVAVVFMLLPRWRRRRRSSEEPYADPQQAGGTERYDYAEYHRQQVAAITPAPRRPAPTHPASATTQHARRYGNQAPLSALDSVSPAKPKLAPTFKSLGSTGT
ncbi:hypothetical protein MIND_00427600 [Mycena indigotica]|uniref:Transmembrane protein n=1 Tax=Mycena indigotica TaxID=2126181 RepID=A0A8H6SVX7_9AGAR|nr:uncharacterized protein MIND_00427600 [Mycena indigotica]KAF7306364.1 hypothetical protein MIND_00427600 [Mycena indigotica]